MDQRWCLGNKKTNKVEKNLYPNQVAQRVIDFLREGATEKDWVVWTTGWPSWKNLVDVPELINEISLLKKMAEEAPPPFPNQLTPPPPPLEVVSSEVDEITNTNIKLTPPPPPSALAKTPREKPTPEVDHNAGFTIRRKHKRIVARFRCIIRSTTLTFRTFTKDISLGGVALEDEIPLDLVGTECTIYISSPKLNRNLKFKVSLTERSVAKYFSFKEVGSSMNEELNKWLDEHQQISAA